MTNEELQTLPEKEAATIRQRYFKGLTLKEAGAAMGVTSERVRQLEEKALHGNNSRRYWELLQML